MCDVCLVYGQENTASVVKETAECTMESLKELDLEQFNEGTDNYVTTHYNWMGIPVRKEYRVFNELLQPGVKIGKRKEKYESDRKLSEKMLEHLTWEIEEVKIDGNQAELAMEISNLNMTDVMGKYTLQIFENMEAGAGMGVGQMIKDLLRITDEKEGLLAIVESCDEEDICTMDVTVTAFWEDGIWKLRLDDAFINAFMGNFNAEEYSEDLQQSLEAFAWMSEE